MAHRISIPTIKLDERIGSVFNHLFRIINDMESIDDYDIEWDFKNTEFLHPFFLASLSIYKQNCKRNVICINKSSVIDSYHKTVSFDKTLFIDKDIKVDLSVYNNKTYTPICSFSGGDDKIASEVQQVVQKIIRKQTNYGVSLQMPLSYLLGELVCNIQQHSRAERGYLFCQYLKNERTLNLCIADNGRSVYASYLRNRIFLDNVTDDAKALLFANNGFSTKGLPQRGYGLRTSRHLLVNGLGGAYFMLSGSAFYRHSKDGESVVLLPKGISWDGTIVLLRIPIDVPNGFNIYKYLEN